jgi:WD40 repeat protein
VLLASTADRNLHVLNLQTRKLEQSTSCSHDSPILSHTEFNGHLLTSSMSGQLHLSKIGDVTSQLDKRQDHTKYIVKTIVYHDDSSDSLVATAGWDGKVVIYKSSTSVPPRLDEPFATISLPTKPESIVFLQHPDNQNPVLLISRTDSTFIYYYSVEAQPRLLGKQNLAPHSNAWVAFTPSSIEPCPIDPTLLAVGTSSLPHMKLMIVRALFPPWSEVKPVEIETQVPLRTSLLDENPAALTQASQARAALAVAEREAAAIQIHCSTLAPQTAYSTPAVAWRPDGSGVWVNGDDGVVRGIETASGQIVATLQGHEPGSKVRCLWAGSIEDAGHREEYLVSGGFDQKLIIWTI